MSGEPLLTQPVGVKNGAVDLWLLLLHPGQQCWSKIETDLRVVVRDFGDAAFRVENARRRIGRVALSGDSLVPIVKGVGGILNFNRFQPRILTRWLVQVAVNADVTFHAGGAAIRREASEVRCRIGASWHS